MAKKALQISLGQVALVKLGAEKYLGLMREMRPWWVVLVPFLAWRGKKTYDKEFRRILGELKTAARTAQADAVQATAKQTRAQAKALRGQAKQAEKRSKELQAAAKQARKKG